MIGIPPTVSLPSCEMTNSLFFVVVCPMGKGGSQKQAPFENLRLSSQLGRGVVPFSLCNHQNQALYQFFWFKLLAFENLKRSWADVWRLETYCPALLERSFSIAGISLSAGPNALRSFCALQKHVNPKPLHLLSSQDLWAGVSWDL